MNRLEEIKTSISEALEEKISTRVKIMLSIYEQDKEAYLSKLNDILKLIPNEKKGVLYISYLRSSYITGSNKFEAAFFEGEPYVDEEYDNFILDISPLFIQLDEDMKEISELIESKFTRILPYEKEVIRRHYMELLYHNCEDIFSKIVADCNNKRDIPVHFGEYIGETKYIGSI